ncbi:MAG: hypothetical protein JHC98_01940 [Thermoleophilaceae bacterium]|nr:hypothetical protein [Thermoleophilaceae bacterium]
MNVLSRLAVRALAPVALLLAIFALPAAAEASYGNCDPGPSSIVARSGDAFIYQPARGSKGGYTTFICSRKFKGRTGVLDNGDQDSFEKLTVNGDFAAFSHTYFNSGDSANALAVEVVNLRTHRYSGGAGEHDSTPAPLRLCDFGGTSEFCYFSSVARVLLTRNGSVAFGATLEDDESDCPEEQVTCGGGGAFNVIYRLEFNAGLKQIRKTALDHVKRKELATLKLSEGRMSWTGHGKRRSAPIR